MAAVSRHSSSTTSYRPGDLSPGAGSAGAGSAVQGAGSAVPGAGSAASLERLDLEAVLPEGGQGTGSSPAGQGTGRQLTAGHELFTGRELAFTALLPPADARGQTAHFGPHPSAASVAEAAAAADGK